MMSALMLAASSVAFAQDAVKEVLKAKNYADAQALVKANLSSMSDADKAKAYNKLVDLSFEKINKEQSVITANQMAEQFKQGKVEAYDTLGFYNALADALTNAIECDKYDQMPNEKGKVNPSSTALTKIACTTCAFIWLTPDKRLHRKTTMQAC